MNERTKLFPESMYDELCKTLTDFENATDDDTDDNWLSDGEWLDVFLWVMCKVAEVSVAIKEGEWDGI